MSDQLEEELACIVDQSLKPGLTEEQVRLIANRVAGVADGEHVGLYWTSPDPDSDWSESLDFIWSLFVSVRPCRDEHGAYDCNVQIDSACDRDQRLPSILGEHFLAIADDFRRIREAVVEAYTAKSVAEGRVKQ